MTKEEKWSHVMWQAHRKIMEIINSTNMDAFEKIRQIGQIEQALLQECDRITFSEG